MSLPARASFAYMMVSFIQKGLSFITGPIFTRLLTTEQYGQISIYQSWQQIFFIFASLCLSYGVFNNGMLDYRDDRDCFSFSLLILSNIATIILASFIIIFYAWVQPYIKLAVPFEVIMFISFMFQPAFAFWTARQRFDYKYKMVSIITILTSILSPLIAIILILHTNDQKVMAKIFGSEGVLIICYFVFYIRCFIKSKMKIKIDYWKYALKFNLPLIPHYLSQIVLNSMDRLMIAALISESAAGIYSVAYSAAAVVSVIWSSINSSLIPWTYEKCEKKAYDRIAVVTQNIVTVYAIICIMVIYMAPEIMMILAPKSYLGGVYVIPPILGGVFFSSLYFIFANVVYYYKSPKYVMYASVIAAISNFFLNWWLIPIFGYVAAGYTTLFSYIVQTVIDYFAMRKVVGQCIYNMKYLIALTTGVMFIALTSNLLYPHTIIRYSILGIVIILCIVFREKIKGIIRAIKEK